MKSKTISSAVHIALRDLLMVGRKPEYLIKLHISPNQIDVNIHPRKQEIRFLQEQEIFRQLHRSLRSALEMADKKTYFHSSQNTGQISDIRANNMKNIKHSEESSDQKLFYEKDEIGSLGKSWFVGESQGDHRDHYTATTTQQSSPKKSPISGPIRVVGQIHDSYILVETEQGMMVVDQHAAAEKINYVKLKDSLESGKMNSQILAIPQKLELSDIEYQNLKANYDKLQKMGYDIEYLTENNIIVQAIPEMLSREKVSPAELVRDLLSEADEDMRVHDQMIDYRLATMACKMSIKFGDKMSYLEQEQLVRDTIALDFQYCPHGRPVLLQMSFADLDKALKRHN